MNAAYEHVDVFPPVYIETSDPTLKNSIKISRDASLHSSELAKSCFGKIMESHGYGVSSIQFSVVSYLGRLREIPCNIFVRETLRISFHGGTNLCTSSGHLIQFFLRETPVFHFNPPS